MESGAGDCSSWGCSLPYTSILSSENWWWWCKMIAYHLFDLLEGVEGNVVSGKFFLGLVIDGTFGIVAGRQPHQHQGLDPTAMWQHLHHLTPSVRNTIVSDGNNAWYLFDGFVGNQNYSGFSLVGNEFEGIWPYRSSSVTITTSMTISENQRTQGIIESNHSEASSVACLHHHHQHNMIDEKRVCCIRVRQ